MGVPKACKEDGYEIAMSRARKVEPLERIRIIVAPVEIEVDGCTATILESLEYETMKKEKRYFVAVKVKCRDMESPVFRLDVKNEEELLWKLRAEIAKAKLIRRSLE